MGPKPCPFCGKKARLLKLRHGWLVGCNTDGCISELPECAGDYSGWYFTSDEAAIEAWNKRAAK